MDNKVPPSQPIGFSRKKDEKPGLGQYMNWNLTFSKHDFYLPE